ncbi:hypothetical protein POJ06DRAFT_296773 [Lipomyces tetrasporus]|uniref:RING-type domain-containing protein n=1 Tax=Lipomyces tetrasporus TaxID=54092 RepID=A0AAD7QND9_9ASCO|nr:uncharacterized protein POJ06DRAFT_296773 [Lipomyces tetrasporus]KAJ8098253.1 hypothetical protein POJ06DRAFT_296773 [Lipomyces tetrasporus]
MTTDTDLLRKSADEGDLRDLHYTGEVSLSMLCPICYCVFVEPYSTTCGHTFCRTCIQDALSKSSSVCPVDRAGLCLADIRPSPIVLYNLIDELRVYCHNKNKGCTAILTRSSIHNHTNDCTYALVKCPLQCCCQLIERRYIDSKDDFKCLHNQIECAGCLKSMMDYQVNDHLRECGSRALRCPDCFDIFAPGYLEHHRQNCQYYPCPAALHGCSWSGSKNDLLATHAGDCQYILLAPFNVKYNAICLKFHETMSLFLEKLHQSAGDDSGSGAISVAALRAMGINSRQDLHDYFQQYNSEWQKLLVQLASLDDELKAMIAREAHRRATDGLLAAQSSVRNLRDFIQSSSVSFKYTPSVEASSV